MNQPSPVFKPSPILGYFCIGGAALCWAISATMGRAVFLGRLHLLGAAIAPVQPLILAQSRTTLAAMVLFPALWLARGRHAVRMRPREIRDCVILGIFGVAASNYLYYLAIQRTNVATAIILQYLAPVFVLLWMLAANSSRQLCPASAES